MQRIKAKSVLAYFVLPRIIPRLRRIGASGFGYIAFLMARIYNSVRLLPDDHPYVNPQNIGLFGIRHVIAEAANNLVIKRENIDQIIVFVALMSGVVLLIGQFVVLIYMYVVSPAMAQSFDSLFDTPSPRLGGSLTDIAFVLLDDVFGIPEIFCNSAQVCTDVLGTYGSQTPRPFHLALHDMFEFYSLGLLIIGMIIFLYFVMVVVFETAATGTPFGQRFQNGWVPIRLVAALGLLVPIHHGLNSGQFITLYAAKFGSGFATNTWLMFNESLKDSGSFMPSGEDESMLALPTAPDVTPIAQAMSLVHACAYAYWHTDSNDVSKPRPPDPSFYIRPYFVKVPTSSLPNQETYEEISAGTTYEEALEFYNNGNIIIRFGEQNEDKYGGEPGHVGSTCGDIRIPITDIGNLGKWQTVGGADLMQWFYYNMILQMWFDPDLTPYGKSNEQLIAVSQRFMALSLRNLWTNDPVPKLLQCDIGCTYNLLPSCNMPVLGSLPCIVYRPSNEARQFPLNNYQSDLDQTVLEAWEMYNRQTNDFDMTDDILDRGWGGAGLWYNKINQINGGFITSVVDTPAPVRLPEIMERVKDIRMENNIQSVSTDIYSPQVSGDDGQSKDIPNMDPKDIRIASSLHDFFTWWNTDSANQKNTTKYVTGSAFRDVMNMMFGTNALFAMRGKNAHIHPLAQLAALGKGLVDSAVRNVGLSMFASAMGGPAAVLSPISGVGGALDAIGGFLVTTAFVGLTAGFILFYILPFMPFMYFFFAVAEWIKAIFEAMVGVPLWALAHLRIDGEGLPGESAQNGYFLIFEIFIRPILTLFGLVASITIFTAQVRLLNIIWLLVVDNLTGFSTTADTTLTQLYHFEIKRDIVDQFFFTVIYAIIVHMLATASFKLIDSIPDNILRWAGSGASSFGDMAGDAPVQQLERYAAMGGITVGRQATQAFQRAAKDTGGMLASLLKSKP